MRRMTFYITKCNDGTEATEQLPNETLILRMLCLQDRAKRGDTMSKEEEWVILNKEDLK